MSRVCTLQIKVKLPFFGVVDIDDRNSTKELCEGYVKSGKVQYQGYDIPILRHERFDYQPTGCSTLYMFFVPYDFVPEADVLGGSEDAGCSGNACHS